MSKQSFTPGPWKVHYDNRVRDGLWELCGYNIEADGDEIVGCEGIEVWKDNAEANARLIAAAPELLEALLRFVTDAQEVDVGGGDAVVTTCESLEAARAAITKARGDA